MEHEEWFETPTEIVCSELFKQVFFTTMRVSVLKQVVRNQTSHTHSLPG